MTAFTLIVSLYRIVSGFDNVSKALSNGILSKSRLADWQFPDKSSWGKDFKTSLSLETNLTNGINVFYFFFKISDISLHTFIASV